MGIRAIRVLPFPVFPGTQPPQIPDASLHVDIVHSVHKICS